MSTKIEWCMNPDGTRGMTWNPVIGCTKVSAGCKNCFAANMASRFSAAGQPMEGTASRGNWTGRILLKPERLDAPLRWRKPRRVFVNSMSDLFHKDVPDEFIAKVLAVMALSPRHTYQVLTKRPERMAGWFTDGSAEMVREEIRAIRPDRAPQHWYHVSDAAVSLPGWPLKNVELLVSIEDQATADERIEWLLKTPAAVRGVSYEPALGPVSLAKWLPGGDWYCPECDAYLPGAAVLNDGTHWKCGTYIDYPSLDWVIAGGETGNGARPAHPDWFRAVRDQCAEAGVPFFFKGWGDFAPPDAFDACGLDDVVWGENATTVWPDGRSRRGTHGTALDNGEALWKVGKRLAGDTLDGVQHHAFPEATR